MMSDLPPDLVEEILSRVPAASLKRLRTTCRRWNALFKDQRFSEKHSHKAAKQSMVLILKEYRVCPMSVNLNVSPPSLEFKGALDLKNSHSNSEQVDIVKAFHCDGLLLCTTKDGTRLVVWNPCLVETTWIELKDGYGRYDSRFALGYIQNNKSCRSYKILSGWNCYDFEQEFRFLRSKIYEFSSDSWRVTDDTVYNCIIQCHCYCSGASSLKGNTYWLAFDEKEKYGFLLSFDFTTERFKRLCLPPSQNVEKTALSVVGEKQLSILSQSDGTSKIDLWVSNEIGTDIEAVLKWSKYLTVDIPICGDFCPLYMSYLITEEKKVAVCYNQNFRESRTKVYIVGEEEDEYYREIPFGEHTTNELEWGPVIFNYFPSLVQIQQIKDTKKIMKRNEARS